MTAKQPRDRWLVCTDYAAGPYTPAGADAALAAVAAGGEGICALDHAIVRQVAKPDVGWHPGDDDDEPGLMLVPVAVDPDSEGPVKHCAVCTLPYRARGDRCPTCRRMLAPAEVREADARDFPHDEPCPRCGRRQWGLGPGTADPANPSDAEQETCGACGYRFAGGAAR